MNKDIILSDKQKEIKLMPLLDSFYDRTLALEGFTYERIKDSLLQIKGVDIIIRNKEEEFYVDEKCAVRFFEKDRQLKTYSFELFSLGNKNCDGWFCNNNFYLTTHYCLFYPIADNQNLDNVLQLDMILVEKENLWDIVRSFGFNDKEELIEYFHKHKDITPMRDYCNINNTIKLVQSKTFREKPINIIFKREELERLAYKKYSICF